MEIRTYDQVDPLQVLKLSMNVLGFPLTPAAACAIRTCDARARDCFCLYAVQDNQVVGQVGLFMSDVMTLEGPVRFGAFWAVCTDPSHGRQGIARTLSERALDIARQHGCKAITLATNRGRVAHRLYRSMGFLDLFTVRQAYMLGPDRRSASPNLTVRCADPEEFPILEALHREHVRGRLGFVLRQEDFLRAAVATGLSPTDVHGVYLAGQPVGYAIARRSGDFLRVGSASLPAGLRLSEVVLTLKAGSQAPYVLVESLVAPGPIRDLEAAGFDLQESFGTVMLLPLEPGVDPERLLGVAEERFFMDQLDFT